MEEFKKIDYITIDALENVLADLVADKVIGPFACTIIVEKAKEARLQAIRRAATWKRWNILRDQILSAHKALHVMMMNEKRRDKVRAEEDHQRRVRKERVRLQERLKEIHGMLGARRSDTLSRRAGLHHQLALTQNEEERQALQTAIAGLEESLKALKETRRVTVSVEQERSEKNMEKYKADYAQIRKDIEDSRDFEEKTYRDLGISIRGAGPRELLRYARVYNITVPEDLEKAAEEMEKEVQS